MSFELPPPGVIPDYDDLESMTRRRFDNIVDEFSNGSVVAEVPEKMVIFGKKLLELLVANMPDAEKPAHKTAVDQAMNVAVVMVDRALRPRYYDLSLRSMDEAGSSPRSMLDFVYHWPQEYMQARPHLSRMLEMYTAPYGVSEDAARDIVVVGGLIFAQVEEARINKYVEFHMRKLDAELPDWQQMLNDRDTS
jgi:hypothetical protein